MISLFKNNRADKPSEELDVLEFVERVRDGHWKKLVDAVRYNKDDVTIFKKLKNALPAVTVSGKFNTRDKFTPVGERLANHSGFICIDVDRKDNPKLRMGDLVDKESYAEFLSASGDGKKIIYKCAKTKDPAEHRRIYDAVIKRLDKKIILKVDPVVKSIANLQYVTYDPDAYINTRTKLTVQPLPAVKRKVIKPSEDALKEIEQLKEYITVLDGRDVTSNYEDWMLLAFGLSYSLGESGRVIFHELSSAYKKYSEEECNEKYDSCLESSAGNVTNPVTLKTVYSILIKAMPKVKVKQLARKYNKGHAVGEGEDVEQGDLAGMVRFKLFLFKKIIDKDTMEIMELIPNTINLNEFEKLLKDKGFHRYDEKFIWIQNNIVEEVDLDDVMRIITQHVEQDGDYTFDYKNKTFQFSWEELVHLWRTIRAYATTYNQIASSLTHWIPNLLTDTPNESYIPYSNGVCEITKKKHRLIEFKNLSQQIWKERILPRPFTYVDKVGAFEEFFTNVTGRGETKEKRNKSEFFRRALWYYGYMLHGIKRQSTARAWLLYDIKTGNNGRSGKTIIGNALGKIRSVVKIDGKTIDFKDRFKFQTVQPWTDIVFIDDPSKYMSLNPLFNVITGELTSDRKNRNPLTKSIKLMIASNWILESEGTSESGRQFVTQLDDYYVRYAKEHGNTITPIMDAHGGKEFFTDWEAKDWNQFDSFAVKALQFYLSQPAPSNTIIGNSKIIRFIQINEKELYYELCHAFVNNYKITPTSPSYCIIAQNVLIHTVKENKADIKNVSAGRVAREFLQAIGASEIEITSVNISGQTKMAYKLDRSFEQLDFGEAGNSIKSKHK